MAEKHIAAKVKLMRDKKGRPVIKIVFSTQKAQKKVNKFLTEKKAPVGKAGEKKLA
jgi:type I site-specific restriction endonuclease